MRNASRRSFTVEVKSGARRGATVIPSRLAAVAPSPPLSLHEPESSAPPPEPRRILPSLLAPEPQQAEPEPMPFVVEDLPPRRPRGRPRKLRPDPVEPVAEAAPPAAPEPAPVPKASEALPMPAQAPRKSKAAPALDLARGERWKRRLGRWSR